VKKKRLIPVLLLKNGWLVQSKDFNYYKNLGNPITAVKRLSEWAADELIYIDITKDVFYDINRDDLKYSNFNSFNKIIKEVAKSTFMPLTVGGKIRSLKDIEHRIKNGADKVIINTIATENIKFINTAAKEFGKQCIVVSVDYKKINNKYLVYSHLKSSCINLEVEYFCKKIQELGAGEIFINSVDRDGSGLGYDISFLKKISKEIYIPIICCGGAGKWEHFEEVAKKTNVDGIAAANIFHYKDQSVYLAKEFLCKKKLNFRKASLI
jgi:cyclase